MIDFLVGKLHDARFMTMLLSAIAASATAYTLIMPLFAGESLAKRMKGARASAGGCGQGKPGKGVGGGAGGGGSGSGSGSAIVSRRPKRYRCVRHRSSSSPR